MTAYCCQDMQYQVEYRCEQHPDPYDCPDNVIVKADAGYFGLPVHDGGSSHIVIRFCPWCGTELPGRPGGPEDFGRRVIEVWDDA